MMMISTRKINKAGESRGKKKEECCVGARAFAALDRMTSTSLHEEGHLMKGLKEVRE